MRNPAVAGQFYPGTKDSLTKAVEQCFFSSVGPRKIPLEVEGHPRFGVAPHAGYVFSGPTAARTISAMASHIKNTIVIIGPNHTGTGGAIDVSLEDFSIPTGVLKNDVFLGQALIKNGLEAGEESHRREHSLEVQLPLIQRVNPQAKITPVILGDQSWSSVRKAADVISACISEDDVVLASSDFTHCGINYGQSVPKETDAGNYARQRDALAIEKALLLDARGFLDVVYKNQISVCGAGPVAAVMEIAKMQGASRGVLLEYITSYDISPGPMAVGYASIVFV